MIQNKNTIITGVIISFLLLITISFAQTFSELGESCQYSRDCAEGYCLESICKLPAILDKTESFGICSKTADCFKGFCKDNECILPKTEKYDILPLGIKSSCAGFIENCTGIWCSVCNVSWILLAVGTAVAAFITRKRGRRVMILMIILPVLTGLILFPILGFAVSLMEIGVYAFIKKKKPKRKEQMNEIKLNRTPKLESLGFATTPKKRKRNGSLARKPKKPANNKKSKKVD